MIPATAWRASSIGPTRLGPGAHRVLLALWDHAHGWRPGDGEWPVYPSVAALASKLGVGTRAVYGCLTTLEATGWIRPSWIAEVKRHGWLLSTMPVQPKPAAPEAVGDAPAPIDARQLGLPWSDNDVSDAANEPVDNVCTTASTPAIAGDRSRRPPCKNVRSASSTGTEINRSSGDDDASRIWVAYEAARVKALGSFGASPARQGPPPASMRALAAKLGGGAEGWARVEAYGRRAITLALETCRDGGNWADRGVRCREDGGEWSTKRYDAVMRWKSQTRAPMAARPITVEIDNVVDGERVSLHEREAWAAGGEVAVRQLRGSLLAPERMAEQASAWLFQRRVAEG